LKAQRNSQQLGHAVVQPEILTPEELCHKIKDELMELAAAWEYSRQLYRASKKIAREFDKLRQSNRNRNKYNLVKTLVPTRFFRNRFALTFLGSPRWPNTPFLNLKKYDLRVAFPCAPVFQEPIRIPGVGRYQLPAESITPNGTWSKNWSAHVLDFIFKEKPIQFRAQKRLFMIDTSYELKRIREALEQLLKKEIPSNRKKGRNKYEAALKDLALLRSKEAGWDPKEFDELWKKAGIAHPLSEKTDKCPCGVDFEARHRRIKQAKQLLKTAFRWSRIKHSKSK